MYARFVSQELCNVRKQVRSGFDSTTLDNKVHVSFGCAPALQTLNDSKVALESVTQQVMFGLITLKRAQATPLQHPPRRRPARPASSPPRLPRSRRPPPGAARPAPPAGKPVPQADGRSSKSRRTATRSSPDKADVDKAYDRPLSDICMHVLLRGDGKDSDCPHRDKPGHESGGKCHDTNGVNPKDIPHKSSRQGGDEQPSRRRRFGGQARK
jgi:hypothetical protein